MLSKMLRKQPLQLSARDFALPEGLKTEKNPGHVILASGIDIDPVDRHFAQTNLGWTQLGLAHAKVSQIAQKGGIGATTGKTPLIRPVSLDNPSIK